MEQPVTTTETTPSEQKPVIKGPFEALPDLKGPLEDGTFVRPGKGYSSLFYKYENGSWFWTPEQDKAFWMPVSELVVSEGKWKGKKPAHWNVAIIKYLLKNNPTPPADLPVQKLDDLVETFVPAPKDATSDEVIKMQAMMGNAKIQDSAAFVGEKDRKVTLGEEDYKNTHTVVFKDCRDCDYTLTSTCTKIMMDKCENCRFQIRGKVITHTIEAYLCPNISFDIAVPLKTLQIDKSRGANVHFETKNDFYSVIWAGTYDLKISFGDDENRLETGFAQQQAKSKKELSEEIDQFIVRFVEDKLVEEKVIRLKNGFPSTKRENNEYEDRQQVNMEKFMKNAGVTVKRVEKKQPRAPPRNSPCPCGSKKKYKNCCGSNNVDKD